MEIALDLVGLRKNTSEHIVARWHTDDANNAERHETVAQDVECYWSERFCSFVWDATTLCKGQSISLGFIVS